MTLIPTQVTFHGLQVSEAVEAEVRERVAWLERFYGRLVRCHVLIEVPHRHHRGGRHFRIRIDMTVPGGDVIVVSHEPSLHATLKDEAGGQHRKGDEIESVHRYVRVAVREAFDVARRRLEDVVREQRGDVKTHEPPVEEESADTADARGHVRSS